MGGASEERWVRGRTWHASAKSLVLDGDAGASRGPGIEFVEATIPDDVSFVSGRNARRPLACRGSRSSADLPGAFQSSA